MADLLLADGALKYKGILNLDATTINTPLDATPRAVTDGMGNVSPLYLSNAYVGALGTVPASANYGLVSIGYSAAAFDGATAGKFVGSANGTYHAINAVSGFGGNLVDYQVAGVSIFNVTGNRVSGSGIGKGLAIGSYDANYGGLWSTNVTRSSSNFAFISNGNLTEFNGGTDLYFDINAFGKMHLNATGLKIGAITNPTAMLEIQGAASTDIQRWYDSSAVLMGSIGATGNATFAGSVRTTNIGINGAATATSKVNITGLPTSAAGLAAGDVWNNSGVLTIV